jgi:hypothetical protein
MRQSDERPDLPPLPSAGGPLYDDFRRGAKRIRKFLIRVLIVLGALILLCAIAWLVLEIEGSRRLAAAFKKAEKLGVPRKASAIEAAGGETNEAAELFDEALAIVGGRDFREALGELPGDRLFKPLHPADVMPPEALPKAAALLESQAEAFELLHGAAEGARSGSAPLTLSRKGIYDAVYALTAAACSEADKGNTDDALEFIMDGLALIASDGPAGNSGRLWTRGHLVEVLLSRGLSYVLWRRTPSREALERLRGELVRTADGLPLKSSLFGAYYQQLEWYGRVLYEPRRDFLPRSARQIRDSHVGVFLARGYIKLEEAQFVNEAATLIAKALNPGPVDLVNIAASAAARKKSDTLRSMQYECTSYGIAKGQLLSAAVAAAALRFKIDNGDWPASIDDLVPAYLETAPTDPFSAAPIVYRPSEFGVIVYSVGINGTDDGGLTLFLSGGPGAQRYYGGFGLTIGPSDEIGFAIWDSDTEERGTPTEGQTNQGISE